MLENPLSKQGGETVDRPQWDGTSPIFIAKRWEAQEGTISVSEDVFGKQWPRTPGQQGNDQRNREKEAAKEN